MTTATDNTDVNIQGSALFVLWLNTEELGVSQSRGCFQYREGF